MSSHQYLVEMTFTPLPSVPSPQEAVSFMERFVVPTLEACQKHRDAGRIVAGGPLLAAGGFTFIAEVESPHALDQMLTNLPLWPRAQSRIVPLGTFEWRTAAAKSRLADARARAAEAAATVPNN